MQDAIDRLTERSHTDMRRSVSHQGTPSRSAAMFHSLFERSGVGMAALDSRSRIRQANDALLALLDRSTSEVRDIEFARLLHPDSRSRLQVGFDQLRLGRTGRFTEYVKVPRPNHAVRGNLTALRMRADARTSSPLLVLLQADPPPAEGPPDGARSTLLSEMEAKILERVAAGASTVQLAGQLHLSCKGIEYHISAMLRKLGVPNRPALVSRAYTTGILSSGTWPPRVQQEHVKCR
ncbi:LuxR C-terminal-related transcriptional regulator [Streptomyces mutabilis]|nr:LuxR C-terminal-related transcriptional regulator [Streptomyces mutabilis]